MPARLLFTRPMPAPVVAAAESRFEVTVCGENRPWTVAECQKALVEFDAIVPTLGDAFTAEAFAGTAPRCRLLANFGVGYNHIDVTAARKSGVEVSNTPGAVTDATADLAILLMLMVARRAGEGERLVRSGRWQGWYPTQMLGMHLGGKTLGIIGMGRIGQAIARRAHFAFGMQVVFFNRSRVADCGVPGARQLPDLAGLMAASDVISVNVPGGAANRHLVSSEILKAARKGSILVNTARGDVIDQSALIRALQSGALAGAGLDVYENEPVVPAELIAMENVVLLPHLGTNALEVRTRMGLMAVDNARAFLAGGDLPNRV